MPAINEIPQNSPIPLSNLIIQKKEWVPVLLKITAVVSAILFIFSAIVLTGCFYPKIALPLFHGLPFYYTCPPLIITLALFSVSLALLNQIKRTTSENIQNATPAPKNQFTNTQVRPLYLEEFKNPNENAQLPQQPIVEDQEIQPPSQQGTEKIQVDTTPPQNPNNPKLIPDPQPTEASQRIEKTKENSSVKKEYITKLPTEIWMLIFSLLDSSSFKRVGMTCVLFKNLTRDQIFFNQHVFALVKKESQHLDPQAKYNALEKITEIELQLVFVPETTYLIPTDQEIQALTKENCINEHHFAVINNLIKAKKISEAKTILTAFDEHEATPIRNQLWYQIVKYEAENLNFREAKKAAEKIVISDPFDTYRDKAYYYISYKRAQQGKFKKAKRILKAASELPQKWGLWKIDLLKLQQGYSLAEIGLLDKEVGDFDSDECSLLFITAFCSIAKNEHAKGNLENAKQVFRKAKNYLTDANELSNKDELSGYYEIAKTQVSLGFVDEARETLEYAKTINNQESTPELHFSNMILFKQVEVFLGSDYSEYLTTLEKFTDTYNRLPFSNQITILIRRAEFEFDLGKIIESEISLKNAFQIMREKFESKEKPDLYLSLTKLVVKIAKQKFPKSKEDALTTLQLIDKHSWKILGILSLFTSEDLFEPFNIGLAQIPFVESAGRLY